MTENKKDISSRMAFADGLRAIAAMWVVLYHLAEGHHIDVLMAKLPELLRVTLFDSGGLGVAVFFVLSGYVMAYTMRRGQVDLNIAGNFLLRRLVRLSPPYYFAIIFSLAFLWLKIRFSGAEISLPDVKTIVAHMLYATDFLGYQPINSVFWTLGVEVQFYIAFALMLLFSDWLTASFQMENARFFVAMIIGLVALAWPFQWISSPLWPGGFMAVWYSFMVGVMVCWAAGRQGHFIQKFSYGYIGLILVSGILYQAIFPVTVAFTAGLILYAEQKNLMGKWLNWRWIQNIGLISYSLYLLHNPITGATANVIRRVLPASIGTDMVIFVVSISACLIAAWLAFKLIELPSIRLSRKVSHAQS